MSETHAIRVAKGSVYLIAQNLAVTTIGTVALAFFARLLTQTEMGIVVVLNLVLGIAQLVSDLGFSSGLTKYIAEYRGKNADYSSFFFLGSSIKVLMAGLLSIVCVVASQQLSQTLMGTSTYSFLFQLLGLSLFLVCINTTMTSFLLGLNRVRDIAALNLVSICIRQVFAIVLLIVGWGLAGLVVGWILGDLIYLVLSFLILLKDKQLKMRSIRESIPQLTMLIRFSWPLFVVSIVVFLYTWFDRVVLLNYVSLDEVAVYNVALQAFSVLYVVPSVISSVLFPYYSEQYGRNKHENIAIAIHATTRYITLLYAPLALGLTVVANPAITLFAGTNYARGDTVLAVLSFLGGISGLSAAFGVLLLVYNMTKSVLLINLASMGASLAMTPVLLPLFGATGMAVIKGVTLVITFVLTVAALRKRLSVGFDWEAMWKGWSAAIVMFLVVGLVELLFFNRYFLPLYVTIGGVVYVMMLRIMKVVKAKDIQLLRNIMGQRTAPLANLLAKILR